MLRSVAAPWSGYARRSRRHAPHQLVVRSWLTDVNFVDRFARAEFRGFAAGKPSGARLFEG